jgi:hypothetical protein
MDRSIGGRNYGVANVLYHHTYAVSCVHLLLAAIILLCHQLVEITYDVVSSCAISVPSRIKDVRRSRCISRLVRAGVVLIELFLAPKGSMP